MAPADAITLGQGTPWGRHRGGFTVLKTAPGFHASKQIIARAGAKPEIRDYSAGKWLHAYAWGLSSIAGLSLALTTLEGMPNCLVIRGAPAPALDCTRAQQ